MKFFKYIFYFSMLMSALFGGSLSELDIAAHDLKVTGGKEIVHQAVADTVGKVDCQIVASGSHVKKGLYKPGKSDHDFTMRILDGSDAKTVAHRWKQGRTVLRNRIKERTVESLERRLREKLQQKISNMQEIEKKIAEEMPLLRKEAEKIAKDFMSRTSLYPPPQLMRGVENEAEAVGRLRKFGASPNIKYPNGASMGEKEWKEAVEGIYGEGGHPFVQNYEKNAGKVWFKDPKTGKIYSGEADLIHRAEGYGLFTRKGMSSNALQWGDKALHAAETGKQEYSSALKYVERMHLNLKKARDLERITNPGSTGLQRFANDYTKIKDAHKHILKRSFDPKKVFGIEKSLFDMLPSTEKVNKMKIWRGQLNIEYAKTVDKNIQKLLSQSHYRKKMIKAIKMAKHETRILQELASNAVPAERKFLRNILGYESKIARKFEKIMSQFPNIAWGKVLTAIFVALDFRRSVGAADQGNLDEAYRTAFEGSVAAVAGMGPASAALLTNLLIEWAKSEGYALSVQKQDCEDLLVGIIAVSGWENAEGIGDASETDIETLAYKITEEKKIRSIVETAIYNAQGAASDTKKVRKKKSEALRTKCMPQIVEKWRDARAKMLGGYLVKLGELKKALDSATPLLSMDPESPTLIYHRREKAKYAEVTLRASALYSDWEFIVKISKMAERNLERLGGMKHKVHFDLFRTVTWYVDDAVYQQETKKVLWNNPADMIKIKFYDKGKHSVVCKVIWQARALSTITEGGDFIREEFRLLSPLWYGHMPGFYKVKYRGNTLATYQDKTSLQYNMNFKGALTVADSDKNDQVRLSIQGASQVFAGTKTYLKAVLDSALPLDERVFHYRWEGIKKPLKFNVK